MSEIYKLPDPQTSNHFVKYIDRSEIKGLISSLAHTIDQKYKDEELILIGVLKGSCIFMAELIREIRNVNLSIDFVKIKSLGRTVERIGTISMEKDITVDIFDKHVLIVEEIIDTGRALHFLKQRLSLSMPKSLETVTLFDKPYKRSAPVKANLIGKQIEDQFIIGHGLDLEDYGRNIEDIFFLKYPN